MKNTFYYSNPLNLEACRKVMEDMYADLTITSYSKEEAEEYIIKMIDDARPLSENNPDMLFYGFDNPTHMPSDSRVYYFYMPTYIAAAMMMKIAVKYPELLDEIENYRPTLKSVLDGCTCRRFEGVAYEERKGILVALSIFLKGDAGLFLKSNGDLCNKFRDQFYEALNFTNLFIRTGKVWDGWGVKVTLEEEATQVIKIYEEQIGNMGD